MQRPEKIPAAVIVMTKDEEQNIERCLRSVADFAEVFVVDSHSADRTTEIARECGAQVFDFSWNGRYPKKKQWSLANLPFSHEWVLYLDADEVIPSSLCEEMRQALKKPRHAGYFVGYDYVFAGRVLRHGHRVFKLILFDRRRGRFLERDDLGATNMWEVEGHYQPEIEGSVGTFRRRALHHDHDSLYHYFDRHNRYSDWEAALLQSGEFARARERQRGARAFLKLAFSRLPFRGLIAFFHSYVFRLGFLDGRAGFDYALSRGFYYWQIGLKLRELRRAGSRS